MSNNNSNLLQKPKAVPWFPWPWQHNTTIVLWKQKKYCMMALPESATHFIAIQLWHDTLCASMKLPKNVALMASLHAQNTSILEDTGFLNLKQKSYLLHSSNTYLHWHFWCQLLGRELNDQWDSQYLHYIMTTDVTKTSPPTQWSPICGQTDNNISFLS